MSDCSNTTERELLLLHLALLEQSHASLHKSPNLYNPHPAQDSNVFVGV